MSAADRNKMQVIQSPNTNPAASADRDFHPGIILEIAQANSNAH